MLSVCQFITIGRIVIEYQQCYGQLFTLTSHQRKVRLQILYGDELFLKVAVGPYPEADINLSSTLMNVLIIFSDSHWINPNLDRVLMPDSNMNSLNFAIDQKCLPMSIKSKVLCKSEYGKIK